LKLDGVYCQWLPNYLLEPADVAMMYKTMRSVFERVDVWSINFPGTDGGELLLVGHKGRDGGADVSSSGGLSQTEIKARLDGMIEGGQFAGNEFIVEDCITPYPEAAVLEAAMDDDSVPVNTDDHSMLEYRVFWNYLDRAFAPRFGSAGSVLSQ
jgi:hypothetical protein